MQPRTASCSCGRANTRRSSGAAPVYQEKTKGKKIEEYNALICGLTKPYRAKLQYTRKKRRRKRRKKGPIGRSSGIFYNVYQYTNV
jgi:hypothetical protein